VQRQKNANDQRRMSQARCLRRGEVARCYAPTSHHSAGPRPPSATTCAHAITCFLHEVKSPSGWGRPGMARDGQGCLGIAKDGKCRLDQERRALGNRLWPIGARRSQRHQSPQERIAPARAARAGRVSDREVGARRRMHPVSASYSRALPGRRCRLPCAKPQGPDHAQITSR